MKPFPLVVAALLALETAVRVRRGRLGRGALVLRVLALVALLVYGLGLVHPPNVEHALSSLGGSLGKWTYLLVGVMAFLETGAFVGLVAPGELTILLGGVLAGQGKISVVVLLPLVFLAAVAGDLASYFLGRRLGRDFLVRHGPKVRVTPAALERVEEFFDRHGGAAIFLGRFIGIVRAVAPFIAGASRLPLRRFLPYDIAGAGIWGCGIVLIGYGFGQSFGEVVGLVKSGSLAVGTLVVLGAAAYWLRDPEHRALARERARGVPVIGRVVAVVPESSGARVAGLAALALAAAASVWSLAIVSSRAGVHGLDRGAFTAVRDLRAPWLTDVAKVLTNLGSSPVTGLAVVLTAVWLVRGSRRVEAFSLVAGAVLTFLAVHVLKAGVDRPRPGSALVHTTLASFPSGHAAYSVVFVAIAVLLTRAAGSRRLLTVAAVIGLGLMVVVGLTRVYLRAHFATDVLGGWALGAACFAAAGAAGAIVSGVRHNARPG